MRLLEQTIETDGAIDPDVYQYHLKNIGGQMFCRGKAAVFLIHLADSWCL
jgi:hypothetical protein